MGTVIALVAALALTLSPLLRAFEVSSKIVHEILLTSPTGNARIFVEDGAISSWSNNASHKFRFLVKKNITTGLIEISPVLKSVTGVNGAAKPSVTVLDPLQPGIVTDDMRHSGIVGLTVVASRREGKPPS